MSASWKPTAPRPCFSVASIEGSIAAQCFDSVNTVSRSTDQIEIVDELGRGAPFRRFRPAARVDDLEVLRPRTRQHLAHDLGQALVLQRAHADAAGLVSRGLELLAAARGFGRALLRELGATLVRRDEAAEVLVQAVEHADVVVELAEQRVDDLAHLVVEALVLVGRLAPAGAGFGELVEQPPRRVLLAC